MPRRRQDLEHRRDPQGREIAVGCRLSAVGYRLTDHKLRVPHPIAFFGVGGIRMRFAAIGYRLWVGPSPLFCKLFSLNNLEFPFLQNPESIGAKSQNPQNKGVASC